MIDLPASKTKPIPETISVKDRKRFWGKVRVAGVDECWEWQAGQRARGYGSFSLGGKIYIATRIALLIDGRRPAVDEFACHHCDNPKCVNPKHLYVGNGKTNMQDAVRRNRHYTQREPDRARRIGKANGKRNNWSRGHDNPRAKLTPEQIREIKTSHETCRSLAKKFNVGPTTIHRAKTGKAWRDYPLEGTERHG